MGSANKRRRYNVAQPIPRMIHGLPTFPKDWMPRIRLTNTMIQANSKQSANFQFTVPISSNPVDISNTKLLKREVGTTID